MLKGYGKILRLDLTAGKISYEYIDGATVTKYIGGVGLAAKMLWEETQPKPPRYHPKVL